MEKTVLKNTPVFIVGMPRSGTTLLSNLINASKQIYIPEETHYFIQKNNYLKLPNRKQKKQSFNEFYLDQKNHYTKPLGLDLNEVEQLKRTDDTNFFQKLISFKLKNNSNIERWGEKTPIHFTCTDDILTLYPNAKIIHIIRDPRDVFNSMIKSNWHNVFPYNLRYEQYKKATILFKKSSKSIINIKYEDLINDSNSSLKKIYSFCNLKYNDSILETFYQKENVNFSIENEPWKANNLKAIDNSSIYKWKKNQDDAMIQFTGWYLRSEIESLNYPSSRSINILKIVGFYAKIKIISILKLIKQTYLNYIQ
tara:strand:- start:3489 stop:4418 length:930 start_codon:yes stop_codon:yes gene_type:complete